MDILFYVVIAAVVAALAWFFLKKKDSNPTATSTNVDGDGTVPADGSVDPYSGVTKNYPDATYNKPTSDK